MNAYELADELLRDNTQLTVKSAYMLRQQADRIAELEKRGKPVAWMFQGAFDISTYVSFEKPNPDIYPNPTPLYTAPQTKPSSYEAEIVALLDGIDKEESECDNGWWETSYGAKFGADVLEKIKTILRKPHKYDPETSEPLIDGYPLFSGLPRQQTKQLSDEEIETIYLKTLNKFDFARAIEERHGIK